MRRLSIIPSLSEGESRDFDGECVKTKVQIAYAKLRHVLYMSLSPFSSLRIFAFVSLFGSTAINF
jgi:hypothetical protein